MLDSEACLKKIQSLRHEGKKIIFTNGVFDILHIGHLSLLEKAKSLGDILCVGINSDSSVKKIKGENRPVNQQEDRARLLAGFEVVDIVTIFHETTPSDIISRLKPDIHVKGGDYNPADFENMPEAKVVRDYGGEVRIISLVPGKSSTAIINKMSFTI
ncbi:MAG: D-glycero-beta-D-manno-heptose 1-phosphate adenylyltransferase [Candidatus Marinimicrobia bacterium]|nr:D-glycero-beta-D-manno-heptose 1-phosphate adenylyltransferase [Candidatus Neomarinimicrobiota bacterium]